MNLHAPPAAGKFWRRGTHRAVPPAETFARFVRHAPALGITRIADVTGLDYLGIPVFMAMRPNARSLSVSQGKGLDEESARVSAFMEAAELDHAEEIGRKPVVATCDALKARAAVVDPAHLARLRGKVFDPARAIAWIEGIELNTGAPVFVPLEIVDMDFTFLRRGLAGCFLRSSNGLASGNHVLEALCSGLCEAIERDAAYLWDLRGDDDRAARRLVLRSVDDPDGRALIGRLRDAGMSVSVWDQTSDIGVACFACRIVEAPGNDRSDLGPFWGYGCHLSRGVALCRAITEAVQSRLTCIAGSRDDIRPRDYAPPRLEHSLLNLALDKQEEAGASRRFAHVPTTENADFESDLAQLLASLRAADLDQAIAVDLTRPGIGIPVVRAVVPGLEVATTTAHCAPGRRARALARSQR